MILLSKHFLSIGLFLVFALMCISLLPPSQAEVNPSDDCSTVDLNAAKDSPFRMIPVYDQDGSKTCYAHTAATLVDYWRIKHGGSAQDFVNPVYAAWLNHYGARSENETTAATNSGITEDVITDLKSHGYCSNQQVYACLVSYQKPLKMSGAEFLYFLETVYKNYEIMFNDNSHSNDTKPQAMKYITQLTLRNKIFQKKTCQITAFMETKQASDIMGQTATNVLADLFKSCKSKKSLSEIPDPQFYFEAQNNQNIQNKIDTTLNQNNPMSLDLCSQFLDQPGYRGLKNENNGAAFRGYESNLKTDCGEHAVIVSAREKISNSCKYLVRNSWGALWHPKGATCACIEADGTYETICKQTNPHEFVGCWYDRKDLIPNTYGVTTL